jgi:hypothetical protein
MIINAGSLEYMYRSRSLILVRPSGGKLWEFWARELQGWSWTKDGV